MKIDKEEAGNLGKPFSTITLLGLFLPLASVVVAMISGFGSRWGLWHFSTGFKMLAGAALSGALSSVIALVGLVAVIRKGMWGKFIVSCISLALGLTVFAVPFSWYRAAKHLPRIHDITTDTQNPPRFVAVLSLRKNAPNSPEYGGPEIAVTQREAYPDIQPLMLDIPPGEAFDKALSVAQKMSWNIVDADKQELLIEAFDTTFWFGFKDDIVIRITSLDGKSRLDMRSVSRAGLSDVGTNAARIKRYLKRLSQG